VHGTYRCSAVDLDLDRYRERAELFCEQIDREYYLHHAGHKRSYEIEAIYGRHAELFSRRAVEELRDAAGRSDGEQGRRVSDLLDFAFQGYLGQAVKAESARLAELEASLKVEADSGLVPYRGVAVALANDPDAGRRAALEAARDELLAERLNPLHLAALERTHELARELGWARYREACAELRGIDLAALGVQADEFARATDDAYAALVDPELERAGVAPLGELRRSDLPRFFRAPGLDELFPSERMVASFSETLSGLGIELGAQHNVHLDTESRETKSPRAFCATPKVPQEIYLIISPVGGRDDYEALLHEGGHTEHFAHVDPGLAFEYRHLGDNSVTESFAFLLQHLSEDPAWLGARLGIRDPEPVVRHARAVKLVMLRRYTAKIAYELELHDTAPSLDEMPARYAELLGGSTRVGWRWESWLADVDPGFYVACYLRAWALETSWRRALRERFGERWFESAEAGEWLRGLWRQGQRLDAAELLAETLGEELGLGVLAEEFAADPG
jgi:hypothetical protein